MTNMAFAQQILQALWLCGVREVVLCAGARNAPFVTALTGDNPFKAYSFFEERSAAFFAIGRILATARPVAVITTSGTAAAELLAPAIEADYQGLPLVMVTADRPKSYRGSGSPQTIIQPGIFSHYVEKTWDFENELSEIQLSGRRPVHINVCFDEPLLNGEMGPWSKSSVDDSLAEPVVEHKPVEITAQKPLVILGSLTPQQSQAVLSVVRHWERPLYVESTSQLRGHPALADYEILSGEASFRSLDFDSVIRIGGVPTLRFWRDLEKSEIPVWHFSSLPFAGLSRPGPLFPLSQLNHIKCSFTPMASSEMAFDREYAQKLERLLSRYPLSEPAWVRWVSSQMQDHSRLYLGNSLPIREWDLAAVRSVQPEIFANRGVNGIDGQVSTFLGVASEERPNWCLLGDLTTLYDLSGPWALRERPLKSAEIVVINNGGGKIFERIFNNAMFENTHDLNFEAWAKMWSLNYQMLDQPRQWEPVDHPRLTEISPSYQQTQDFWKEWQR